MENHTFVIPTATSNVGHGNIFGSICFILRIILNSQVIFIYKIKSRKFQICRSAFVMGPVGGTPPRND